MPAAMRGLEGWLSRALGEPMRIESTAMLGHGTGRQFRKVVVASACGGKARRHLRIVRDESPPGSETGLSPAEELAVLRAAHEAGVLVLRPLFLCEDPGVLGAAFFVTELAPRAERGSWPAGDSGSGVRNPEGEAGSSGLPRSSRERALGRSAHGNGLQRPELARQLGRELAKLHRITPQPGRLRFLERPPRDLPGARIARFRERLDAIGDPQPVLEWAMRQLERNPPESAGTVLCHGAPSASGYLVEDGKLLAILDWAGARWGDPYEDIGEFCVGCRRVVSPHREGDGAASRTAFLDGYREVSRLDLDEDLVRYWEVMATLGRAVTALEEGHRFVAGGERSIELALSGRRVAEMEIDLLVETDRLAMERAHA